eukprot:Rmarinus@m.19362
MATQHLVLPNGSERDKLLRQVLVGVCKKMIKNSAAHFQLALLYLRLNQPQKAMLFFERAYGNVRSVSNRNNKSSFRTYEAKILNHTALCLFLKSKDNAKQPGPPAFPSPAALKEPARAQHHRDVDASIDVSALRAVQDRFVQATMLDPKRPEIWNNLAVMYTETNQAEGAELLYNRILGRFPTFHDADCNWGVAAMLNRNRDQAATCFQRCLCEDGDHVEAYNNYATLLISLGRAKYAIPLLERAIEIDPNAAHLWNNLGIAYGTIGRLADATRAYEQACEIDPSLWGVQYNMCCLAIRMAAAGDESAGCVNENELVARFAQLLTDRPCSYAWTALGTVLRIEEENGMSDDAAEVATKASQAFAQALQMDSRDAVVWVQLALLSFNDGKYTRARDHLVQAIVRDQTQPAAWCNFGIALQLCDQPEEAERAYLKALELAPRSHEVLNNLGNLYRQKGYNVKAREAYMAALELKANHAETLNNIALLDIIEENFVSAKLRLEEALAVNPHLPCAISNKLKLAVYLERRQKSQTSDKADPEAGSETHTR